MGKSQVENGIAFSFLPGKGRHVAAGPSVLPQVEGITQAQISQMGWEEKMPGWSLPEYSTVSPPAVDAAFLLSSPSLMVE